jgi:cell division protein FtsB
MASLLSEFLNNRRVKRLVDVRNLGLYLFTLFVLAITWSGVKTVQDNYELQKRISTLKQENAVLELQNSTAALQNQYFKTDQFLELAARQQLGLSAPGETVLLVPETVSRRYVDPDLGPATSQSQSSAAKNSIIMQNLESWRDFLLGRKLSSE